MNAVMNRFNIRISTRLSTRLNKLFTSFTPGLTSALTLAAITFGVILPARAVPADSLYNYVNLRESATTDSVAQTQLMSGDRVDVLDGMRGQDGYIWYNVKMSDSVTGWVREGLISIEGVGGEFVRSSAVLMGSPGQGVNVRSGPSTWYNVRFTGLHGDRATVTDMTLGKDGNTWYQVAIPNTNGGWVHSNLVQVLNPMPDR